MTGEQDDRLVGPDGAFETLVARQITPEERERLFRIRNALGLSPRDSIWSIFIALAYHHTLYEQIPDQIRDASADAARIGREAAADAAEDAFAKATSRLSDEVAASARKIARQENRTSLLALLALAITVSTAMVGVSAWMGRGMGLAQAEAQHAARETWAYSPVGETARRLADDQFIHAVSSCQRARRTLIVEGRNVWCAENVTIGRNPEKWPDIGIITNLEK